MTRLKIGRRCRLSSKKRFSSESFLRQLNQLVSLLLLVLRLSSETFLMPWQRIADMFMPYFLPSTVMERLSGLIGTLLSVLRSVRKNFNIIGCLLGSIFFNESTRK